ncbi:hypothetical protein MNBD_GAMMA21-3050 [hydrothermal vent metagenome]|uniref:Uncharacterized protein n=1 Tax=hydrothermal vent metagenome TaxID=652676 RepID=A0A3B1AM24_9ZZZZ
MSFFSATVTIPIWFLIMMNVIVLLLLAKLFWLLYRYKQGDIIKEEHSDMVVWKIKNRKSSRPSKSSTPVDEDKDIEKKEELIKVLKILLKEGDKGVMMQTFADRMGVNTTHAQHAMSKLVETKMVDEVVGVSGTKYYLTQSGKDYCRRKAK